MLQILALVALIGVAINTTRTVHRERAVFAEFGQSTAIGWLVWLYPLPLVIVAFIPASRLLIYLPPACLLFFGPAIAVAMVNKRRFQRAGTDRVDQAQRTADYVAMSGVFASVAFIGVAIILWIMGPLR